MIEKSVLLPCDPVRAFALFTREISLWWPADHRPSREASSQLVLRPDGFWEETRDGGQVDLGRVRVWEPPDRLVLDFYIGTDAGHPTEVEVRFIAEDQATRVSITHRPTVLSQGVWHRRADRFDHSWTVVLAALENATGSTQKTPVVTNMLP